MVIKMYTSGRELGELCYGGLLVQRPHLVERLVHLARVQFCNIMDFLFATFIAKIRDRENLMDRTF